MSFITITSGNIEKEHLCCAMADMKNAEGVVNKKSWMLKRLNSGHVFRKLDARAKVFIEYYPAELSPVSLYAPGYIFIQCLWVSGSYAGKGSGERLLKECIEVNRQSAGLVIISSDKKRPFMADKKFLSKYGFICCDRLDPYFVLMALPFNNSELPVFSVQCKTFKPATDTGLVIYYADSCPFNTYYVEENRQTALELDIPVKIIKCTEPGTMPLGCTYYAAFYNGKFIAHSILRPKEIRQLLNQ